MYRILPQGTQILIEKYEPPEKKSDIFLFDETKEALQAEEMPFIIGKILAKGQLTKYAKVGDLILFERHIPIKFTYEGKEYLIFKEEYITAFLVSEQKAEA